MADVGGSPVAVLDRCACVRLLAVESTNVPTGGWSISFGSGVLGLGAVDSIVDSCNQLRMKLLVGGCDT